MRDRKTESEDSLQKRLEAAHVDMKLSKSDRSLEKVFSQILLDCLDELCFVF